MIGQRPLALRIAAKKIPCTKIPPTTSSARPACPHAGRTCFLHHFPIFRRSAAAPGMLVRSHRGSHPQRTRDNHVSHLPGQSGLPLLPAEPPGQIVEDFWESRTSKASRSARCTRPYAPSRAKPGELLRTATDLELALRRGNAIVRCRMAQGTDETNKGRVLAVSMRQEQGQNQLVLAGKLEEGRMHVLIDGGRIDRRLRWSDDVAGLYRREHLFQERKPKPGDRLALAVYDPEVNAIVNLRILVKDAEEVNVLGTRKKLLRVDLVPEKLEGPGFSVQRPASVLWLDEAFIPVRRQLEFEGLGALILTRTTAPWRPPRPASARAGHGRQCPQPRAAKPHHRPRGHRPRGRVPSHLAGRS